MDINSADYSMILKVPGIGLRSAKRIVSLRRQGHIRYEHLQQMGVALNRARNFIFCPGQPHIDRATPRPGIAPQTALSTDRKQSLAVPSSTCSALPLVFLSDGTFEGLLTAIFETYDIKVEPVQIRPRAGHRPSLLFWAMINPRYDILPLVRRHFEKRYADQSWVIFDTVRNYGLYFDKQKTREMRSYSGPFPRDFEASDADEETCRQLWKTYFIAVNITERNNPRLHLRQLPRRYWQYLPEKG